MLLEAKISDPVCIRLGKDSNFIMADENNKEAHPLVPGAILGTVHYGFVLIIDTLKGQKEVVYPTQNRIDAVGIEGDICGDLKIFEKGKYHPWLFSFDGKLKNESSYNQYSKRDKAFVEDCYGLNEIPSGCFTLQKKK